MKANTVSLPLHEYNRLRDFEQKILNGEVLKIYDYTTCWREQKHKFISKDEFVNQLVKTNLDLVDKMKGLSDEDRRMLYFNPREELNRVAGMNMFEFFRWRIEFKEQQNE